MKCEKCGGKIDPTGRYCMECFEPVRMGTSVEELEKPFPFKLVLIAGGAVLLTILAIILLSLRTLPPDRVALEWLEACASRQVHRAIDYTTENFENSSGMDLKMSFEKSEEYATDRRNTGLTFTAHEPTYNASRNPTVAEVRVTFHYGKEMNQDHIIVLRKVRGEWKVDAVR